MGVLWAVADYFDGNFNLIGGAHEFFACSFFGIGGLKVSEK